MSLFGRKNKNQVSESENLLHQLNQKTAQVAGNVALSGVQDGQSEAMIELESPWESINQRVEALLGKHNAFLQDALKKGVDESELAGLVADAMNAGELPKIAEEYFQTRDGKVRLHLLSGNIPSDALGVTVTHNKNTDAVTGRIILAGSPDVGASFKSEQIVLPVHVEEEVDASVLAKIDTELLMLASQKD